MLGLVVKIKGPTFQPFITCTCNKCISAHIYNICVTKMGKLYTMPVLQEQQKCLKKLKEVRYAVHVTFQHIQAEW